MFGYGGYNPYNVGSHRPQQASVQQARRVPSGSSSSARAASPANATVSSVEKRSPSPAFGVLRAPSPSPAFASRTAPEPSQTAQDDSPVQFKKVTPARATRAAAPLPAPARSIPTVSADEHKVLALREAESQKQKDQTQADSRIKDLENKNSLLTAKCEQLAQDLSALKNSALLAEDRMKDAENSSKEWNKKVMDIARQKTGLETRIEELEKALAKEKADRTSLSSDELQRRVANLSQELQQERAAKGTLLSQISLAKQREDTLATEVSAFKEASLRREAEAKSREAYEQKVLAAQQEHETALSELRLAKGQVESLTGEKQKLEADKKAQFLEIEALKAADKETQSKLEDFELLQKQFAALQAANKASTHQQHAAIAQQEKLEQELGQLRKTHATTEKELADADAKIKSLNNTLKQDAKLRRDLEEQVSKLKDQVADCEAIKVDLGMTKSRAQAAEAAAQTAQTEAVEHANRAAERLKDLELSRHECKASKEAAEKYRLKASNADAEAAKVKKELAAREEVIAEFKKKEEKKLERTKAEVERLEAKVNALEASVKAKDKELASTRLQQNEQQKLHANEVEALKQTTAGEVGRLQEMANNQKRELDKLNTQFDEAKLKHKQALERAALDSQALGLEERVATLEEQSIALQLQHDSALSAAQRQCEANMAALKTRAKVAPAKAPTNQAQQQAAQGTAGGGWWWGTSTP